MNGVLTIRPMQIDDYPTLFHIWSESGLPVADGERELHEVGEMLRLNPTSCLVACAGDVVVGSILAIYNGRRGWIHHLAVAKEYQHQGVGTSLMEQAESALVAEGATKIILGVALDNLEVEAFYAKHGYEVLDDAVLMTKDLWLKHAGKERS